MKYRKLISFVVVFAMMLNVSCVTGMAANLKLKNVSGKEVKVVKSKAFQVDKTSGIYKNATVVKVTAKKGNQVYYSTTGKFIKGNKIKSGKSKKITFKATGSLYIFSAKKVLLARYTYTIVKPVITPVKTIAPVVTSTPVAQVDHSLDKYVAPVPITASVPEVDATYAQEDALISCQNTVASVSGSNTTGVTIVQGSTMIVKITAGGTYHIKGALDSGKVVVDAADAVVHLVFDGITFNCAEDAAVTFSKASLVKLTLVGDNHLTDKAAAGVSVEPTIGEGTLVAKKTVPVIINGAAGDSSDRLVVTSTRYKGIMCKNSLKIINTSVSLTSAKNNGISGSLGLGIFSSDISVSQCGGDGIKSGSAQVHMEDSYLTVNSGEDGVDGETTVYLKNTSAIVKTEKAQGTTNDSFCGVKAVSTVEITGEKGMIETSTVGDGIVSTGGCVTIHDANTVMTSGKGHGIEALAGIKLLNVYVTINGEKGIKGESLTWEQKALVGAKENTVVTEDIGIEVTKDVIVKRVGLKITSGFEGVIAGSVFFNDSKVDLLAGSDKNKVVAVKYGKYYQVVNCEVVMLDTATVLSKMTYTKGSGMVRYNLAATNGKYLAVKDKAGSVYYKGYAAQNYGHILVMKSSFKVGESYWIYSGSENNMQKGNSGVATSY